jgi:hypothetical protein
LTARTGTTAQKAEKQFRKAYALLSEFRLTVDTALEGDHPHGARLLAWLERHEKGEESSHSG